MIYIIHIHIFGYIIYIPIDTIICEIYIYIYQHIFVYITICIYNLKKLNLDYYLYNNIRTFNDGYGGQQKAAACRGRWQLAAAQWLASGGSRPVSCGGRLVGS